MRLLLPVVLLLASGCVQVELMRSPFGVADPNAPINEQGTGEIRYLLAMATQEENRAEAYRQMKSLCRSPYRIDWESPDVAHLHYESWRTIRFSCVAEKPAAAPTIVIERVPGH